MAKTDVTKTWDDKEWKNHKDKWQNKKEYEVVKQVRDRFVEMETGRRTSCPWEAPEGETVRLTQSNSLNNGTGSDWSVIWDMDWKLWSMYKKYVKGRTNLKSPITFAPVEAAMAEFQENEMRVTLTPTQEDDKGKVSAIQQAINFLHGKGRFNKVNAGTFHENLICGSAWTHVTYVNNTREVDIILSGEDAKKAIDEALDKNDEESQKVIETLDTKKKPLTRKETITEYDDVALIHPSLYEIYVDPDARCMRGSAYEATDLVWRQIPSLEQFRAEFRDSKDPFVVKENIDKVGSAMQAESSYASTQPFFSAPGDFEGNKVELLRYYNKQTDKYIVIANDVIVRNGPLPFNHKQIPFVLHKAIVWEHQFYGVGLARVLESLQSEDETLRNMAIDQLKLNLNPPIFINDTVFEDIDLGWEEITAGLKVPVGGSVGPENIRWFEGSQTRMDFYQMRNTLREDAVMTSGVNPLAYSIPKAGEPVRNNMMSLESTLKMLKKIMKNWADGYEDAMRQVIKIMQQKYTDEYAEELENKENDEYKEKAYRSIMTQDVQITENENGDIEEKTMPGMHSFQLKNEYLDLAGDVDIKVDVDTLLPMSMSLKLQRIDKAMTQLIPIFAQPQLLENSAISQMVREYIELNGLSTKMLDVLQDETSKKEIAWAEMEDQAMESGESVPGVPGRSHGHLFSHTMSIIETIAQRDRVEEEVRNDPATAGTDGVNAILEIEKVIQRKVEHLKTDQIPKDLADKAVLAQASQPPMGEMPMGQPGPGVDMALQAQQGGMMQGMGPEQAMMDQAVSNIPAQPMQ